MKIDMNFERVNTGRVQSENINLKNKNIKSEDSRNEASSQIQDLSKKRALVDAIVINQIALSFVQKAVMISSRLRSIASEAQTGGNIKGEDLSETLSSINSSLNEMQETSGPVGHAQENIMLRTGVTVNAPQINEEINAMKNFSGDMASGTGRPDLKKIDRINESLTNKASQAADSIKLLSKALPESGKFTESDSTNKISELAKKTVTDITKLPEIALKSQGNLSYGTAKALI